MKIEKQFLKHCPSFINSVGDFRLEEVAYETDTRANLQNKFFIALKGEKFDGFNFVEKAIAAGAIGIVWSDSKIESRRIEILKLVDKFPHVVFIEVLETTLFLQDLARVKIKFWRSLNPKNSVFGIAGSNGKTTTKEMITHFLRKVKPDAVHATIGNLNNHLGVPHTILAMPLTVNYLILEMGSNHPGELDFLCDICTPDCGTITNIGLEHMEFFSTEKDVFDEESTIFHRCMKRTNNQGLFVVNGLDPYLKTLPSFPNVKFLGTNPKIKPAVDSVEIDFNGRLIKLINPHLTGAHNFFNLANAFVLSSYILPESVDELILAAPHFAPRTNRSSWVKKDGHQFYLDAYNANPSSMKVALQGFYDFLQLTKRPFNSTRVILGDMNELGTKAPEYHEEIGVLLRNLGAEDPVFIGRLAENYKKGFQGPCKLYSTTAEFKASAWPELLLITDTIFLKASRSLQLESLLDINH